jgi:pyridinium-3,5-biscarboxylic acid mononucleotide sulfurtransferase
MEALVKEQRLRAWLAGRPGVLVAFSAGVDSSYLLALAHAELAGRAVAVTADSPSLTRRSLAEAEAFCRERGIDHRIVVTAEFEQPAYLANDGQRCYHCKSALMSAMSGLLEALGPGPELLLGAIADDLADWRPGMRAAAERGARFPLADLGFTKDEVRGRSQALGLPTWNRPAEPCLSSRVPYGEPVSIPGLAMIEQAEEALRYHGFATCRARHHRIGSEAAPKGWLCRLEVPDAEIPRLVDLRAVLVPALKRIGYAQITVDLAGFVSGGGNTLL